MKPAGGRSWGGEGGGLAAVECKVIKCMKARQKQNKFHRFLIKNKWISRFFSIFFPFSDCSSFPRCFVKSPPPSHPTGRASHKQQHHEQEGKASGDSKHPWCLLCITKESSFTRCYLPISFINFFPFFLAFRSVFGVFQTTAPATLGDERWVVQHTLPHKAWDKKEKNV